MKKDVIISGPRACGKSFTGSAIAATHNRVLRTNPSEFKEKLMARFPDNIIDCDLIIVDECAYDDIIELCFIKKHLRHGIKQSMVFLTRDILSPSQMGDEFHVINLNNHR